MKKILILILAISLSLSILIISIEIHTFNLGSYKKSYTKYELLNSTNKNEKEFLTIANELILYLKGKSDENTLLEYFNHKEVLHMVDVLNIYKDIRLIKYICIVLASTILLYLIITKNFKKMASKIYRYLNFNYIFLLSLLFMVLGDFNKYFTKFHHIFFDNDLWLLDPSEDLLIQMMPEEFFFDMAFKILVTYIFSIIAIQVISYLYNKKTTK